MGTLQGDVRKIGVSGTRRTRDAGRIHLQETERGNVKDRFESLLLFGKAHLIETEDGADDVTTSEQGYEVRCDVHAFDRVGQMFRLGRIRGDYLANTAIDLGWMWFYVALGPPPWCRRWSRSTGR